MGELGSGWWFGPDRRWRKGEPPPRWSQAADGSWHPPADDPSGGSPSGGDDGDDRDDREALPARHMAGVDERPEGGRRRSWVSAGAGAGDRDWPWARIAGPVSIAVVTLCAIVAIASVAGIAGVQTNGTGDSADGVSAVEPASDLPSRGETGVDSTPRTTVTGPAPGAPASTTTSIATPTSTTGSDSSSTSTTTTSQPPGTEAPPTTEPAPSDDPFALCSQAELEAVSRGNHPWSWVVARLDPDGDGVYCN
jgi:hypothetical protein